jgi:hypothetical protein
MMNSAERIRCRRATCSRRSPRSMKCRGSFCCGSMA